MEMESLVYSSEECMKLLGMSKDLFWQLVHNGTLPAIKVSERKYLFSKAQIAAWLAGNESKVS